MSISIEIEAARYRLGVATGRDLALAAEASMLAGADSHSLVLLASETNPIMSDAAPLFERALGDLHIVVPEPDKACWVILNHHLSRIAIGDVNPRDGVEAILAEVYYPGKLYEQSDEFIGDSHGIHHLLGYFYGIDDIMERPDEVSCDGKYGAEAVAAVEARLRQLTIEWLSEHGAKLTP